MEITLFGTSPFGQLEVLGIYRNSYRYRFCHIYETVKLNRIELSNRPNCDESEKRFKALIGNGLV